MNWQPSRPWHGLTFSVGDTHKCSNSNSRWQLHPAVPSEFFAAFDSQVAAAHVQSLPFCFLSTASQSGATAWFVSALLRALLSVFQGSELMPVLSLWSSPACASLSCGSPHHFTLLIPNFLLFLFMSRISPLCCGQCFRFAKLAGFCVKKRKD